MSEKSAPLNPEAREWSPTPPSQYAIISPVPTHQLHYRIIFTPYPPSTPPLSVSTNPAAFTAFPPPPFYFYSSFTASPVYPYSPEPVNFPAMDKKNLKNPVEDNMSRPVPKSPKFHAHGGRMPLNPRAQKKAWIRKKTRPGDGGTAHASAENTSSTTVMIKNIPNQLRRDFMLNCLDHCCRDYSMAYDFFYLPMDFRSGDNFGYAFANFTNAASALKFKKIFHGFKWGTLHTDKGMITSNKICHITWARIQGKDKLLKRFGGSIFICDRLDYLPVLLDPPRDGLDPNPPPPEIVGEVCYGGTN